MRRNLLALNRSQILQRPALEVLAAASVILFPLIWFQPDMLSILPATGGDTGSHYWPLHVLREHAASLGTLRIWSPGNLGGEPLLVHYFPLPFLMMTFLALFMPTGLAFNLGTILPVFVLPGAIWWSVQRISLSRNVATLSAAATLPFLFNEGYSMWGGNALSLLAGQFAHLWAVVWMFVGAGLLVDDLRRQRFPWRSALAFAAVCMSHAYIMLCLPAVFLGLLIVIPHKKSWKILGIWFGSGILAILLSIWFLVPMVLNAKWTTPFAFQWKFTDFVEEVVPPVFWPVLAFGIVGLVSLVVRPWAGQKAAQTSSSVWRQIALWLLPSLCCLAFYFAFPKLGLVDVRAIPQLQLFVCLMCASAAATLVHRLGKWERLAVMALTLAMLGWTAKNVVKFPSWVKWNYSGWQAKELYPDLYDLSAKLKGNFSDPRVVFEHHDTNNKAGTTRVFEMLPWFAGRSTNESLYMQSTILAPVMFHLQAQVSRTPSCPFPNYACTSRDIVGGEGRFDLLAVGDLILLTEEVLAQAKSATFLEPNGTYGPWNLFKTKDRPSWAGVFTKSPEAVGEDEWRKKFWIWYRAWPNLKARDPEAPRFLVRDPVVPVTDESWVAPADCVTDASIDFNKIHLTTTCPGKAHFIKTAFHGNWRAQSGEKTFAVSPGFLGVIPQQAETTLEFVSPFLWKLGDLVSIGTLVVMILVGLWLHQRRRVRAQEPARKGERP
jgi:hypothetical protein